MITLNGLQTTKNTSFAVLGLGKFGLSVAKELCKQNYTVLCCDKNASPVHEMSKVAVNSVQAHITDASVLQELGIGNYDVVIVGFGHDLEMTLITTMVAKEMGVPYVVARANGIRQKKILESVGANWIVMPEIEVGEQLAHNLISDDPLEYIHHSTKYDIVQTAIKHAWVGKSIGVLNLPKIAQITPLAVIRNNVAVPDFSPNTVVQAGDQILAIHYPTATSPTPTI